MDDKYINLLIWLFEISLIINSVAKLGLLQCQTCKIFHFIYINMSHYDTKRYHCFSSGQPSLACPVLTVSNAEFADCNGDYSVTEEVVSWAPDRPVYANTDKDR